MRLLITGAAGFVGFHCVQRLASAGREVMGIDNLNGYYDPRLKAARLAQLEPLAGFRFERLDLADREAMARLFAGERFDVVLHLGAQAGVRHSLDNPFAYLDSNLAGMLTVLEGCRQQGVRHLIYASSSSVYGANTKLPFAVDDRVDHPVSLYAATKKAGELMAETYAHLYRLPSTGLRFFTVYGPWGRPDMAYYRFADAILSGRPIEVYNRGEMRRDFSYIDDIVDCVERIVERAPTCLADPVPHRLYNLGHHAPERLTDFIAVLEDALGRRAERRLLPMQPGDVPATYADIAETRRDFDFEPRIGIREGIPRFVDWYLGWRRRGGG